MGLLSTVGNVLKKAVTPVDIIKDTAGAAADIVERWKPGVTTKHQMQMDVERLVVESQKSARENDVTMNCGIPIVDGFVNGANRLIRPGVTIYVLLGVGGVWELPDLSHIPDLWAQLALTVVAFWFGGRVIMKDIPMAISETRKALRD
jgi:hypothetical protein